MKHQTLLAGLALVTAGLVYSQAQAATNLVVNPGFETGDLTGYTMTGNYTIYDGVVGSNEDAPHSGFYELELGNYASSGPAGVTQTITTAAGQSYDFSFYFANDGDNPAGSQLFNVTYDGNTLKSIDGETSSPYTLMSFTVLGTGSDTFGLSGYSNSAYNDVDDISFTASAGAVSAVPELSTWLLMIAGIGGIGLMLRRAKKRVGFGFRDVSAA
jgi:hypothetical protein